MSRTMILEMPLCEIMRPEIAMSLQHVLRLYTVGNFLTAWRNPDNQRSIEQVFDTPEQARHAAVTCAAWLGVSVPPAMLNVPAWWRHDHRTVHA